MTIQFHKNLTQYTTLKTKQYNYCESKTKNEILKHGAQSILQLYHKYAFHMKTSGL